MEINLPRKGLTSTGHMSPFGLIGQVETDGNGLYLSCYAETWLVNSRELQLLGFVCELG